ncbi:MAG: hypothetical protein KGZ87_05365 [Bacteroidetes bacterium]|nr:hypothetical protein [Bacteroidota bacterium]
MIKQLQLLKRKITVRMQFLIRKRNQKRQVKAVIKKYKLNDPIERQKIVDQFYLIQHKKRAFGRKKKLHIEEKVRFMIHHKLIKIV